MGAGASNSRIENKRVSETLSTLAEQKINIFFVWLTVGRTWETRKSFAFPGGRSTWITPNFFSLELSAQSYNTLVPWMNWITRTWTWLYIGTQDVWFFFIIVVFVSKYGHMKLGKDDEEPEYRYTAGHTGCAFENTDVRNHSPTQISGCIKSLDVMCSHRKHSVLQSCFCVYVCVYVCVCVCVCVCLDTSSRTVPVFEVANRAQCAAFGGERKLSDYNPFSLEIFVGTDHWHFLSQCILCTCIVFHFQWRFVLFNALRCRNRNWFVLFRRLRTSLPLRARCWVRKQILGQVHVFGIVFWLDSLSQQDQNPELEVELQPFGGVFQRNQWQHSVFDGLRQITVSSESLCSRKWLFERHKEWQEWHTFGSSPILKSVVMIIGCFHGVFEHIHERVLTRLRALASLQPTRCFFCLVIPNFVLWFGGERLRFGSISEFWLREPARHMKRRYFFECEKKMKIKFRQQRAGDDELFPQCVCLQVLWQPAGPGRVERDTSALGRARVDSVCASWAQPRLRGLQVGPAHDSPNLFLPYHWWGSRHAWCNRSTCPYARSIAENFPRAVPWFPFSSRMFVFCPGFQVERQFRFPVFVLN